MMLRNWLSVDLVLKINSKGFGQINQTPFSNFSSFVYTAIRYVVVQKHIKVQQHSRLVLKNCKNFCHYVGI